MDPMHKSSLERIIDDIDRAVAPDKMSPEEALNILTEIQVHIKASIDGLNDDIACAAEEG